MKRINFIVALLLILSVSSCNLQSDFEELAPADTIGSENRSAYSPENQSYTAGVMWPQFYTITIGFLNGTTAQQDTLKKYAQVWDDLTNLTFVYVDNPADAMVRIQYDNTTTSAWSRLGYTEHQFYGTWPDYPTMVFSEVLGNWGTELYYIQTIRHEFGHMLGLEHEQRRWDAGIDWVDPVSQEALSQETFENYLSSDYDITSIMHYSVYEDQTISGMTVDGYITRNGELSTLDSIFIYSMYPWDGVPWATTYATRNP